MGNLLISNHHGRKSLGESKSSVTTTRLHTSGGLLELVFPSPKVHTPEIVLSNARLSKLGTRMLDLALLAINSVQLPDQETGTDRPAGFLSKNLALDANSIYCVRESELYARIVRNHSFPDSIWRL